MTRRARHLARMRVLAGSANDCWPKSRLGSSIREIIEKYEAYRADPVVKHANSLSLRYLAAAERVKTDFYKMVGVDPTPAPRRTT